MTVDADALEAADAPDAPSPLGSPGLSWTGDGALAPTGQRGRERRRERSALGSDVEEFPPILEEGERGYPLASFNRRWVGFLIDFIVIVALASVVTWIVGAPDNAGASATAQSVLTVTLIRLGYGLIFNPRGWSPGKLVVGLRIVNEHGEPPGPRWGVMRTAATEISQFALWIGYIWAYWDKKNQTWQDKLARTYVVHVEDAESREEESRRP